MEIVSPTSVGLQPPKQREAEKNSQHSPGYPHVDIPIRKELPLTESGFTRQPLPPKHPELSRTHLHTASRIWRRNSVIPIATPSRKSSRDPETRLSESGITTPLALLHRVPPPMSSFAPTMRLHHIRRNSARGHPCTGSGCLDTDLDIKRPC